MVKVMIDLKNENDTMLRQYMLDNNIRNKSDAINNILIKMTTLINLRNK